MFLSASFALFSEYKLHVIIFVFFFIVVLTNIDGTVTRSVFSRTSKNIIFPQKVRSILVRTCFLFRWFFRRIFFRWRRRGTIPMNEIGRKNIVGRIYLQRVKALFDVLKFIRCVPKVPERYRFVRLEMRYFQFWICF